MAEGSKKAERIRRRSRAVRDLGVPTRRSSISDQIDAALGRSRGGSSTAERDLASALGKAQDSGDDGLFGWAKDVAGGAVGTGAKIMGGAFDALDTARAAVVAGAVELGDGARALAGKDEFGDNGRIVDSGFSLGDFLENTRNNIGVGDVLEGNTLTTDMPINAKRALGFVGDVALDPLTYATFGTSVAAKETGKATGKLLAKDDVVRRLVSLGDDEVAQFGGREAVEKIADEVARLGAGRLGRKGREGLAEAIGVKSGVSFAGRIVPGTERLSSAAAGTLGRTGRAIKARTTDKINDATWAKLSSKGALRKVERKLGPVKAIQLRGVLDKLRTDLGQWTHGKTVEFEDIVDRVGNTVDKDTLRRALEDPEWFEKAGQELPQAAVELRRFMDTLADEAEELTGRPIPRLDNYLSHSTTEAFQQLAAQGDSLARVDKKRQILGKGQWFLGEQLEKGTIDEIEAVAKRVLGEKYVQVFKDDPWELTYGYIHQLQNYIRRYGTPKAIADAGLGEALDESAVRQMFDAVDNRASFLATDVARLEGEAKADFEAAREASANAQRAADQFERVEAQRAALTDEADRVRGEADAEPGGVFGADEAEAMYRTQAENVRRERAELERLSAADEGELGKVQRTVDQAEGAPEPDRAALIAEQEAKLARAEEQLAAAEANLADKSKALEPPDAPPVEGWAKAVRKVSKSKDGKWEIRGEGSRKFALYEIRDGKRFLVDRFGSAAKAKARAAGDETVEAVARRADEAAPRAIREGADRADETRSLADDLGRQVAELDELAAQVPALQAAEQAAVDAGDEAVWREAAAALSDVQRRLADAPALRREHQRAVRKAQTTGNRQVVREGEAAQQQYQDRILKGEWTPERSKRAADWLRVRAQEGNPDAQAAFNGLAQLQHAAQEAMRAGEPGRVTRLQRQAKDALRAAERQMLDEDAAGRTLDGSIVDDPVVSPADPDFVPPPEARKAAGLAKGQRALAQKRVDKAATTLEELKAVDTVTGPKATIAAGQERLEELREIVAERGTKISELEQRELDLLAESERIGKLALVEEDESLALAATYEAAALSSEALMSREVNRVLAVSFLGESATRRQSAVAAKVGAAKAQGELASLNLGRDQLAQMVDDIQTRLVQFADNHNVWADESIVEAVEAVARLAKPDEVGKLMRMHDNVLSRWKAYSLMSPGYHSRNFFSGIFQNALAGMDGNSLKAYTRFGHAWRKYQADGLDAALAGIKDEKFRDAFRVTVEWEDNLFGRRQVRDYEDAVARATDKGLLGGEAGSLRRKLDPTALDNAAITFNFNRAEGVERTLRGPLFIDGIMSGLSPEEAYGRVVKFHFDYTDLGQFERKYMKRIVPFYTWTRKNLPLQVEMMARRPGLYSRYWSAKRNLEQGTEREGVVPSFYGPLAIRSPFVASADAAGPLRGEDGARIYLMPDLPFQSLSETFNQGQLLGQVSPVLKTPAELVAGKQFFSDVPFTGEYTEMPKSWAWAGPLLKATSGKFGLPTVKEKNGQYFISDRDAYKLEQAMPLLGRARRLAPSEDRYQNRAITSTLSTIFGLSSRTNDSKSQSSELYRRQRLIEQKLRQHKNIFNAESES